MKLIYKYITGFIFIFSLSCLQQTKAQNTLISKQVKLKKVAISHNGDNLVLNMDVNLDNLSVSSNHFVVFTPYIISKIGNDSSRFVPIMVNGRKQHLMYERGNRKKNYPSVIEIRRKGRSQTVHYFASVPYQYWMKACKLNIAEDLCGCGQLLEENSSTVMKYNDVLPIVPMLTIMPTAELKKERNVEGRAYLDFPVNQTRIYPEYRNNPKELSKIIETISLLYRDKNIILNTITIHGYASPEGSYANNTRLARGRALALQNYVKRLFDFKNNQLSEVQFTPEDWNGLADSIMARKFTEKQAILDMINSKEQPDLKEADIKKTYPIIYSDLLKNVYPGLRHSDYMITYTIRPFNLDELKEEYKKNPANLSVEEMYKLAKEIGFKTKEGMNILETAAHLNPNNQEANLNAAQAALYNKDFTSATLFVEKAGNCAEALYTKGAIKLAKGDINSAEGFFHQAKGLGLAEADKALSIINQYK